LKKQLTISALLPVLLGSCASFSPGQVVKPSDITLDKALQDVAYSLHHVQDKYPPEKRMGLIADEVTVQFQVAASATNGGSGTLNIAAIPVSAAGGTIGGSLTEQQSANANRGNTITLTFRNLATADLSKGIFRPASAPKTAAPLAQKPEKQGDKKDDDQAHLQPAVTEPTVKVPSTMIPMSETKILTPAEAKKLRDLLDNAAKNGKPVELGTPSK
jgi:hypothetical protein